MAYFYLQALTIFLLLGSVLFRIKLPLYILAIILVIFSGFRFEVGVDYLSYIEHFSDIKNGEKSNLEAGVVGLANIVFFSGGNEQAVLFILSLLTISLFFNFLFKFSKNYYVSFLIFVSFGLYYLGSFNLVRQYLAIAIFSASIIFIVEKSFVKYLLMILIATLFHLSAIVFLPLYFILTIKLKTWHFFILFMASLLFVGHVPDLISYTKYAIYLQDSHESTMNNTRSAILVYLFFIITIGVVLFRKIFEGHLGSTVFINMAFISAILISMSVVSDIPNMFFYRLNNYFMVAYLVLASYLPNNFKLKFRMVFYLLLTVFMCVYWFYLIEMKGVQNNLLPYNMSLNVFL